MKYKIRNQTYKSHDERCFILVDENGEYFNVDIFTDGGLEYPEHNTAKEFEDWLSSLVGKEIEIENIIPMVYSTQGKVKVIEQDGKEHNLQG